MDDSNLNRNIKNFRTISSKSFNSNNYNYNNMPNFSHSKFVDSWSDNVENILEKVRINCVYVSNYHNKRYHFYKSILLSFRIPIIILSAINSFSAVGLQNYMNQQNISILTSVISLFCGLLTSIEMLLNIQKKWN